MKTMTLKIVFSFNSRRWKNEVRYFIREKYVMDVLKKSPMSIMQNLTQTEEYAKYEMANIQQHFVDTLETKSKMIIKKNDSADTPNGVDVKCARVNTGGNMKSTCVVPVNLTYSCSGKIVKTHELLDSCSQGTLMLEKLLHNLGVNGQKTSITIKTVNGEVNSNTTLVQGFKVSSSKDEGACKSIYKEVHSTRLRLHSNTNKTEAMEVLGRHHE